METNDNYFLGVGIQERCDVLQDGFQRILGVELVMIDPVFVPVVRRRL